MRRREFTAGLGGAVAWSLSARAQQRNVRRVGYLGITSSNGLVDFAGVFRIKIRELGYVEGQNLILDVRTAEGNFSRLPALATELVAAGPEVIVAASTPAALAAQRATTTIPIIMTAVSDPLSSGLVTSLGRPGGNITGFSIMATDFTAKTLELLHAMAPAAKRVAVLMSTNPVHAVSLAEAQSAAKQFDLTIVPVVAPTEPDLDAALVTIENANCEALLVLSDSRISPKIVQFANAKRLPAFYQVDRFVEIGGLASYGPDTLELFRQPAIYVDRILKGANVAELPVQQPTKFELHVNLRTAKMLGLTVPQSILLLADKVIE